MVSNANDPAEGEGSSISQSRRHTKACLRCRKRKVKCPGGQPCTRCVRTQQQCQYDEGRKVVISESYLRSLERNVSRHSPVARNAVTTQFQGNPGSPDSPHSQSFGDVDVHNPLTGGTHTSTMDALGGHHYIGASSTWGFAWRARQLLRTVPNLTLTNTEEVDDVAHIRMVSMSIPTTQDARQLPQETVSRYLSNYGYHVAPLWYFCSLTTFANPSNLPNGYIPEIDSLILVQFNLVMAIGKLLEQGKSIKEHPGAAYFWFALSHMQMLNESQVVARAPLLVSQNYCLIAFYYHAINMRNDAYVNIGKATRIAITQGLHRISSSSINESHEEARVRFWWSLYHLDMSLSSLMGSPVPMHQNEITTRDALPCDGFPSPIPLMFLVKVGRVIATTISEIYGVVRHDGSRFVQSIINTIDGVDQLVKTMPEELKLNADADRHTSRTSATLHLSAYQTVILAVRPVLFQLVERKVSSLVSQDPHSSVQRASKGMKFMLRKLIDAATMSVKILESLKYQGLLQTFLNFDVTAIFSAAVILVLATFVSLERKAELNVKVQELIHLLDELGSQGNNTAYKRCAELRELDRLLNSALQNSHEPINTSSTLSQPPNNIVYDSIESGAYDLNLSYDDDGGDGSLSSIMTSEHTIEDFDSIISQLTGYTELFPFSE